MLIFSFRARAGRLSFVDFFFPYIDVASHVFVVSVMCILKNPIPARDPSILIVEHAEFITTFFSQNVIHLTCE